LSAPVLEASAPTPAEERGPQDVAVDIHSRTLYVLSMDRRSGAELGHARFPHTPQGGAQLLARLSPQDRVVLEATTGAHHLANRLEASGATVLMADPQALHLGTRGKKTDYRDCRTMLKHLRTGELVTVWRPDRFTRLVRQLTRERHAYNGQVVRLKNRIQALLREEGITPPPERWAPQSGLWTEAGEQWLKEQQLPPLAQRILQREAKLLVITQHFKAEHDEELAQLALESAPAQRLMQLVGFGAALAVLLLGEVGDFHRFTSSKKLVSYAGLDPRVHQSDTRQTTGAVSKAGRNQLRWLLIEAAWTHVNFAGPEAEHYHRLVARGKKPNVAIVALARRLLVIAYCLLTRTQNYDALEVERYERKLVLLARHRRETEQPQEANVVWAADRVEAVTGQPSTWKARHPGRRPLRPRRAPNRTSATAVEAPGSSEERLAQSVRRRRLPADSSASGRSGGRTSNSRLPDANEPAGATPKTEPST
jgi:transposase